MTVRKVYLNQVFEVFTLATKFLQVLPKLKRSEGAGNDVIHVFGKTK